MESEEVEQVLDEDSHETEYKVIPVQLVEYGGVSLSTASHSSNINLSRGKYYKQTYRPAWEQMPDFKGWLRGVSGEPTRAYCTYCHKTLHAHRLSLLKHTCTIRHQKAAILHGSKKNKSIVGHLSMEGQEVQAVLLEETDEDVEGQSIEFVTGELDDAETEHDNEDEGDCEEEEQIGKDQFQKPQQMGDTISQKTPISTQVVDMMRGKPITGLQVSLYKLIDGRWTYINEGITDSSGKFSQFVERCDFTPGRYKLHYDVDRYFVARKQNSLYPFIEIVFDSTLCTESYHIPLLLSPFGYTTYRGNH